MDNKVILYDENDNEVEFEIIHILEKDNHKFVLLTDEEYETFVPAEIIDGEYYVIEDEKIISIIKADFNRDMSDIMDGNYKSLSVNEEVVEKTSKNSKPELPLELEFDMPDYLSAVQNNKYEKAVDSYNNGDYEEALNIFYDLSENGNKYAYAYLGMMYKNGEGCLKDEEKAYSCFLDGMRSGCPLATSWVGECYRVGLFVDKDIVFSENVFKLSKSALKYMCYAGDTAAIYFYATNLIFGFGTEVDKETAIELLNKSEAKKDHRCGVLLGRCYLKGWGVDMDAVKGFKLLLENCTEKNNVATFNLGKCYYYGEGTEKDLKKAVYYFEMSAKNGHKLAKDYLGDCYYYGRGVEKDFYTAAKWYKDAADNNDNAESAYSLAFMYVNGEGVREDLDEAIKYFLKAAEGGNRHAQKIVAEEYVAGNHLTRDYDKAFYWMEKAAEQNYPEAQVKLGSFYVSDMGHDDDAKSFGWFMKAAELGFAQAQCIIGQAYVNDFYVERDETASNMWLQKAVEQDYVEAKYRLGINYLEGIGGTKRIEEGISLIETASNENFDLATDKLADIYFKGLYGVSIDIYKARKYAEKALDESDGRTCYRLASILNTSNLELNVAKMLFEKAIALGVDEAKLPLSIIYLNENSNSVQAFSYLGQLHQESAEAQYYYAYCLENGIGCNKDKHLAKKMYSQAVNRGFIGDRNKKKKFGLF